MSVRERTSEVVRIGSDPDVFEEFYRRNVDGVLRFVVRRVEDPYLAADLTADIFVAAIESAHTYRADRGDPTQWLYGVARNVVGAERRRSARERRATRRVTGRAHVADDDLSMLLERIDAESRARDLYRALDRLSDDDRGLLELVAVDGLSVAAAADEYGISHVAARVRLHRARRRLRELLSCSRTDVPSASVTLIEEATS
jgi:RNA polymerase sigma factor (sigma-70 family)